MSTVSRLAAPIPITASLTPLNCEDEPDWYNIFGDDCKWYENNDEPGCPINGSKYDGGKGNATSALEGATDSLRNIGRLGIPVTVNVEFWYGPQINPHLFQIKDSFIQSVEVNYTPTGVWNAYEDGAPIETQLTVALKENAIITQSDIQQSGGF
jgi:hypothetical protein